MKLKLRQKKIQQKTNKMELKMKQKLTEKLQNGKKTESKFPPKKNRPTLRRLFLKYAKTLKLKLIHFVLIFAVVQIHKVFRVEFFMKNLGNYSISILQCETKDFRF